MGIASDFERPPAISKKQREVFIGYGKFPRPATVCVCVCVTSAMMMIS